MILGTQVLLYRPSVYKGQNRFSYFKMTIILHICMTMIFGQLNICFKKSHQMETNNVRKKYLNILFGTNKPKKRLIKEY